MEKAFATLPAPDWNLNLKQLRAERIILEPPAQTDFGVLWIEDLAPQEKNTVLAELDFAAFSLQKQSALFWQPGQILRIAEGHFTGYLLRIGLDALCQQGLSDRFIHSLGLFGQNALLQFSPRRFQSLQSYWQQWYQECQAEQISPLQTELASTWLRLILLYCAREQTQQRHSVGPEELDDLGFRFQALLEERFRDWHQVQDYADALAVTPGHLNQQVKQASGLSAKAHIQERLMLEARRAAYFSAQSLKEIAYDLGFDDPAYFSRLFKRCSGQSFRQFREQQQKTKVE